MHERTGRGYPSISRRATASITIGRQGTTMATDQRGSSALGDADAPEPSGSEADRAEQAQEVDDTAGEDLIAPDPDRLVPTEDDE